MMTARSGCLVVVLGLLINCCIILAEDGYQQCITSLNKPMVITKPQLLKIEAPPPNVYETCLITFKAPRRKYVELVFTELDLGQLEMNYRHVNSCANYQNIGLVVVQDGSARYNAPKIGHHLCGQTDQLTPEQRVRRSTGNVAGIIFSNNIGRFQVQFNIVDIPGKAVCPSRVVKLSGNGTITFPFKEEIYVQSSSCRWRIRAGKGKRVKLTNKKNDIGGHRYWPDSTCMDLALNVYDNPAFKPPPMQQFCYGIVGQNVTEIISTRNAITMEFATYELYTGTGFEMDYEEI